MPPTRLASYGTLQPGGSNHAQVAELEGRWITGTVRGEATVNTTGKWAGYPGFHPNANGPAVPVMILESEGLPEHWQRLDAFEGEAYERVEVVANTAEGPMQVCIYALKRG